MLTRKVQLVSHTLSAWRPAGLCSSSRNSAGASLLDSRRTLEIVCRSEIVVRAAVLHGHTEILKELPRLYPEKTEKVIERIVLEQFIALISLIERNLLQAQKRKQWLYNMCSHLIIVLVSLFTSRSRSHSILGNSAMR